MLLGQIYNSTEAWRKLSSVSMHPMTAYKVLKYTKLVEAEWAVADKQRVGLIHEITETKDGQDAKIEPGTPEFTTYVERLNEVMVVESTLKLIKGVSLEDVLKAVGDKDDVLTVSDLALLEPFFKSEEDSDKKE